MAHLVLLGDSVFDNAASVPHEPAVIEQLRSRLGAGWTVSLRALDGNVTADVEHQLRDLPADATHLVVSCGGNDALGYLPVLREAARSVAGVLERFAGIRAAFRDRYRHMLHTTRACGLPLAVCTVYDRVPDLEPAAHAALAMFNEVIFREALATGITVIDLRLICAQREDFSALSPIEPSRRGGARIADAIADFASGAGPRVDVLVGRPAPGTG